jgi:hypothetical protein
MNPVNGRTVLSAIMTKLPCETSVRSHWMHVRDMCEYSDRCRLLSVVTEGYVQLTPLKYITRNWKEGAV